MRHPWNRTLPIAQSKIVTNGAAAIQAAPCGHRLGISGQFRETFATERPNMRQAKPVLTVAHLPAAPSLARGFEQSDGPANRAAAERQQDQSAERERAPRM